MATKKKDKKTKVKKVPVVNEELFNEENAVDTEPRKTYSLTLSVAELVHLRDLFSVLLPPTMTTTVSAALAAATVRKAIEAMLWNKVVNLCGEAGLPVGAQAPDFVVVPVEPPPLDVAQIAIQQAQEE